MTWPQWPKLEDAMRLLHHESFETEIVYAPSSHGGYNIRATCSCANGWLVEIAGDPAMLRSFGTADVYEQYCINFIREALERHVAEART